MLFGPLKALALEHEQRELQKVGVTEIEQLEAANRRVTILEEQVREAERYQSQFSDLHAEAEERADTAETQLNTLLQVEQSLEQLKNVWVKTRRKRCVTRSLGSL